jgi:hypothetical protein
MGNRPFLQPNVFTGSIIIAGWSNVCYIFPTSTSRVSDRSVNIRR